MFNTVNDHHKDDDVRSISRERRRIRRMFPNAFRSDEDLASTWTFRFVKALSSIGMKFWDFQIEGILYNQ